MKQNFLIIIGALICFGFAALTQRANIVLLIKQEASWELMHIFLSTVAFGVFYLAAFQALLLSFQEFQLHRRQYNLLMKALPPLEKMEALLFSILKIGFVLLTSILITSMWCFYPGFNGLLLKKFLISVLAWLVFVILFLGRHILGWRGQIVARWTLAGVVLVTILYFFIKI